MTGPQVVETDERDNDDRDYVNSLARGLTVIRAFSRNRPSMTLSDVAKRTGLDPRTSRKYIESEKRF